MHAAIDNPKATLRGSAWPNPRTSTMPATIRRTAATCDHDVPRLRKTTPTSSTSTGAPPRASGYTTERGTSRYAAASSPKYASSKTPEPARYGHTAPWAFQTTTATGANTTSAVTSATTVADSVSSARASSRFHTAWKHAAPRARASAVAGTLGR